MVVWVIHRYCMDFQRLSALLMDEQQCWLIPDFREGSCSLKHRLHFSQKANWVLCKFLSEEKTHTEPNTHSWSGSISPTPMRKCSWVTSKISVFWFRWLSAPLFLISSIARSRKPIVLLHRSPNVAFLGSAISDLGHCKFNRGLEAPVS